jgi:hypothetical protein
MGRFASNTDVSSERSRAEIETTLRRYGATSFAYGWEDQIAMIGFSTHDRKIRFILPLPDKNDSEFAKTPAGRKRRNAVAQELAWEQACRQRWRALALVIKAKLEAVESGITTFENEFLAHIVLPGGQSAGQYIIPKLESVFQAGKATALLPAPGK